MADLSQLSKEAKEAFVNSKMEEIRRKNEELRKRHEEVEADKRNAELNSKAAYLKKNIIQGNNGEKPAPVKPPTSVGRGKRLEKVAQEKLRAPEYQRRQQRLSEDENPPPDPVYNFLHDKSREGKDSDDRRQKSRRHVSNFGGQDFANVKNTMQMRKTQEREHPPGPPRNKMDLTLRMTGRERKEYENWRIEREKIEEDRLARQRTATGEWRREWDKDKIIQDEQESSWTPRVFRGRGRGNSRNFRRERGGRNDNLPYHETYSSNWHSRGRGGQQFGGGRKPPPHNYESNQNKEVAQVGQSEQTEDLKDLIDRKVLVEKDSLKISFNNTLTDEENEQKQEPPPTPPPNKSWVGPQNSKRVGSGRILSTSSQSDDERNSFPNSRPFKRGKAKGHAFGDRRSIGRGDNRGAWQDRSERSMHFKSDDKEDKNQTDSSSSVIENNQDKNSLPVSGITKDSEEIWEMGGDESWEDVTTSGNESLELSGPAVEEVDSNFKCRFDNDLEGDRSAKNLSAEDPFEFSGGISDLTTSFDKEQIKNTLNRENKELDDPFGAEDALLPEGYTENLMKKDNSYQSSLFQTCFENPDEPESSLIDPIENVTKQEDNLNDMIHETAEKEVKTDNKDNAILSSLACQNEKFRVTSDDVIKDMTLPIADVCANEEVCKLALKSEVNKEAAATVSTLDEDKGNNENIKKLEVDEKPEFVENNNFQREVEIQPSSDDNSEETLISASTGCSNNEIIMLNSRDDVNSEVTEPKSNVDINVCDAAEMISNVTVSIETINDVVSNSPVSVDSSFHLPVNVEDVSSDTEQVKIEQESLSTAEEEKLYCDDTPKEIPAINFIDASSDIEGRSPDLDPKLGNDDLEKIIQTSSLITNIIDEAKEISTENNPINSDTAPNQKLPENDLSQNNSEPSLEHQVPVNE